MSLLIQSQMEEFKLKKDFRKFLFCFGFVTKMKID